MCMASCLICVCCRYLEPGELCTVWGSARAPSTRWRTPPEGSTSSSAASHPPAVVDRTWTAASLPEVMPNHSCGSLYLDLPHGHSWCIPSHHPLVIELIAYKVRWLNSLCFVLSWDYEYSTPWYNMPYYTLDLKVPKYDHVLKNGYTLWVRNVEHSFKDCFRTVQTVESMVCNSTMWGYNMFSCFIAFPSVSQTLL